MIVYKLSKVENGKELSSVVLTDAEIDAVFAAMADYQDYGDDEAEVSASVCEKLLNV